MIQPFRPLPATKDERGRRIVTRSYLAGTLGHAGICSGDIICAHVSLSRLGYVPGAAQTVIEAMQDAVGPGGTVMMPAFSGELSDPATWRFPPVPADWIELIRAEMPVYDSALTPTREMGVVAELFRHWPGTRRSPHPHSSFAACGPRAPQLVDDHPLDYRFGPGSPLGRLVALNGKVMLLGAGVERATIVYLAQYLAGIGAEITKSAPMIIAGKRQWVTYRDIAVDNALVKTGVDHLLRQGIARSIPAGDTHLIVFEARTAVAALLEWRWRDANVQNKAMRTPMALPSSCSYT